MTISTRSVKLVRTLLATAVVSGLMLVTSVQAQGYSGPSTASSTTQKGYSGPSTVSVTTAKALTETGHDKQHAILRGRIVSHNGGDNYTFEDETGRIRVDIDDKDFPAGAIINEKTPVELHGELERKRHDVEFDVDSIKVM